jgi:hypothetical protein
MIQLRFIKRDLDCIVPTQIVMLPKDFANSEFQVVRNLDFAFNQLPLCLLEYGFQSMVIETPDRLRRARCRPGLPSRRRVP